jgi:hypothetical protein
LNKKNFCGHYTWFKRYTSRRVYLTFQERLLTKDRMSDSPTNLKPDGQGSEKIQELVRKEQELTRELGARLEKRGELEFTLKWSVDEEEIDEAMDSNPIVEKRIATIDEELAATSEEMEKLIVESRVKQGA